MDKIRVLEIANMEGRYGIENYIMNMLRNLNHDLVQVDFLSPFPGPFDEEIKSYGGEIFRITPLGTNVKKLYRHYKELMQLLGNNPEIRTVHIHGNTAIGCLDAYIAKKARVSQIIVHSHSDGSVNLRSKVLHLLSRAIIKNNCTINLCCSDAAGKWMFGKNGKYTVVKNAIPLEKFKYDPELATDIRQRYGITKNKVIGHVGRMEPPKNHKFILRIFKYINELHPETRLILVGYGDLGEEIEKLYNEMGLRDKIIHIRECDCVEKILQAMDVFVFPSLWEGLGISLVEAQASGLKCIVSDIIKDEVCVTDLIEKHSLEEAEENWAAYVWNALSKEEIRYSEKYITKLNEAGYGISEAAKKIQDIYLGNQKRGRESL